MKASSPKSIRCAIYTRVSTEQGLDQDFNSLDAQYEAASAYIKSQAHAGWTRSGHATTMVDTPEVQPTGRTYKGYWKISARGR